MSDKALFGFGRWLIPIPSSIWRRQMATAARKARAGLAFMTEDHHRVRDYVVKELPRSRVALPPETISRALELTVARVREILDELERRLTFLFRDEQGRVAWAYPVTVAATPHVATFDGGERINSA